MSKMYIKLHTNSKAAKNHALKIKARGGTIIQERTLAGIKISYHFEKKDNSVADAIDFLQHFIKAPFHVSASKTSIVVKIKVKNRWLRVVYKKHDGLFHNYHEVLQELKKAVRSQNLSTYPYFK